MKLIYPFDVGVTHSLESTINPASGLPMIEGSNFDIAGNFFGTNYTDGGFDTGCGIDIDISGGSMFDCWGDA
jgi:hypothetical protein